MLILLNLLFNTTREDFSIIYYNGRKLVLTCGGSVIFGGKLHLEKNNMDATFQVPI